MNAVMGYGIALFLSLASIHSGSSGVSLNSRT